MADTCKCCGKKISALAGSYQLSDEYNEPICGKCMNQIENQVRVLRMETSQEKFNEEKQALARLVKDNDFTEDGKQYIFSYIDFLDDRIAKMSQKEQEKENQKQKIAESRKHHMITTGYNFEGYHITSYIGVLSGSVVLGTGFLSEFGASISDFFGTESNLFSSKLESAREGALSKLADQSADAGGNALIGVDYDYITFSGNMIGVVASGTSVVIEKNKIPQEENTI